MVEILVVLVFFSLFLESDFLFFPFFSTCDSFSSNKDEGNHALQIKAMQCVMIVLAFAIFF